MHARKIKSRGKASSKTWTWGGHLEEWHLCVRMHTTINAQRCLCAHAVMYPCIVFTEAAQLGSTWSTRAA